MIYLQLTHFKLDLPRTNNVAEGWHNAFASMTGVQRPSVFKFIDSLKKDEDIARVKINSCVTGLPAPPQLRKYKDRTTAIKNSVNEYVTKIAEKKDDSDDENDDNDIRANVEREKWLKGPEMVLLAAIATHSKL